jgi:phosphoribosyl 1,2-cyclic phosphodiesterase
MDVFFRSYRSGSAGNCLAVWTPDSGLLIDCGVKTLRDCRTLVRGHRDRHGPVAGALVSHAHGDHLSRDGFRVLREHDIPILSHRRVAPQLLARIDGGAEDGEGVRAFPGERFTIGEFDVTAVPLTHAPGVPNFGFVIVAGHGTRRRTIVVCTDFNDVADIAPHVPGADFLFVEANHDLDLLRRHFNPNSRYHLNNGQTASLLCDAARSRRFSPRAVVLGHLSAERNRDHLALDEVRRGFAAQGLKAPCPIETAPRFEPSDPFRIR